MKLRRALVALAATFALPTLSANATIVIPFSDNFDSEGTAGQSTKDFASFTNWDVAANTSVDLIDHATNPWGISCASGSGKCIDLDGSSSSQGTISTNDTFSPGTYTLQFDLSGSQRGSGSDSVTVTFGNFSQQFTRDFDDPWETIVIPGITVTAGNDVLTFASSSNSSDNIGLLLDNVLVPLPAAFWLFSSGLIGMIGLSRRRKALQG